MASPRYSKEKYMVYRGLTLMLTNRCNASCAFCGLRCGPSGDQVMSLSLGRRLIDEAAALGFERVGVTGGEPFLVPNLMFELLEYAKEVGIPKRTVATNGFWGSWSEEKLEEAAERLKACVTHVSVSHDAFHAEYVPTESVFRAADALAEKKIECSIHVADVYGEKGAGPFMASLAERGMYRVFSVYPLAPYGRAEDLPREIFIRSESWDTTSCNTCGILAVSPDGTLFPCCSLGSQDMKLCLGNVNTSSLSGLLAGTREMQVMNVLSDPESFRDFMRYAKEELGIELPEKVSCGCDLCYLVFRQAGIMERIQAYMERAYGNLLLKALFKKVGGEQDK